jgi:hypothetical protein
MFPPLQMMRWSHRSPPNGVLYLLAGGRGLGLGAGFRWGVGKSPKTPQNPASQVQAVLGGGFALRLL